MTKALYIQIQFWHPSISPQNPWLKTLLSGINLTLKRLKVPLLWSHSFFSAIYKHKMFLISQSFINAKEENDLTALVKMIKKKIFKLLLVEWSNLESREPKMIQFFHKICKDFKSTNVRFLKKKTLVFLAALKSKFHRKLMTEVWVFYSSKSSLTVKIQETKRLFSKSTHLFESWSFYM